MSRIPCRHFAWPGNLIFLIFIHANTLVVVVLLSDSSKLVGADHWGTSLIHNNCNIEEHVKSISGSPELITQDISLIKNNADVGSKIAVCLAELKREGHTNSIPVHKRSKKGSINQSKPVSIASVNSLI